VKAGLLDDRAHPLQRLRPLGGHPVTEHLHAAGAGTGEAEQRADHRRLAGAVGTQEPERAPAGHAQIDAVEGLALAEVLGQSAGLDRQAGARLLGRGQARAGRVVCGRHETPLLD
jgi:hypothetical protein